MRTSDICTMLTTMFMNQNEEETSTLALKMQVYERWRQNTKQEREQTKLIVCIFT